MALSSVHLPPYVENYIPVCTEVSASISLEKIPVKMGRTSLENNKNGKQIGSFALNPEGRRKILFPLRGTFCAATQHWRCWYLHKTFFIEVSLILGSKTSRSFNNIILT